MWPWKVVLYTCRHATVFGKLKWNCTENCSVFDFYFITSENMLLSFCRVCVFKRPNSVIHNLFQHCFSKNVLMFRHRGGIQLISCSSDLSLSHAYCICLFHSSIISMFLVDFPFILTLRYIINCITVWHTLATSLHLLIKDPYSAPTLYHTCRR